MQAQDKPVVGREADPRPRGRARASDAATRPRPDAGRKSSESRDTRRHVVDAAIACILEQGFYRASSNAIADRAGLTWGVIQYHFGTRERLMLAVLEEGSRRLADHLRAAEITGATVSERMEHFFDVLAGYYGSPEYLAFVQVLLNLGHDPSTSEQSRRTLTELNDRANPELRRLTTQVFDDAGTTRTDLRSLVFHALRGLSISHVMLLTNEPDFYADGRLQFPSERRMLARALSLLIEEQPRGLTPPA